MGNTRGLTIIKLIIIVLIIMTVVVGAYISLSFKNGQSRDTLRMADINTLYHALAIYQTSHSNFPISERPTLLNGSDAISTTLIQNDSLESGVKDPLHPTYYYSYSTDKTGGNFTLTFCLEGNSIPGYNAGCTNQLKP